MCVGSPEAGTVATTASDVYMVGGLAYELLTAGTTPFHWLAVNPLLFTLRRASRDPVLIPGTPFTMPGLLGKSVLEVAAADGIDVPWCVRVDGSPGSLERLEALKAVVTQCLAAEPGGRPKVAALLDTVGDLLAAEVAEVGPGALDSEAQRVVEATALRDELAQARAQHAAAVTSHASVVTALESRLVDAAARNAAEIASLQQAAAGSATRHASEVAALRATVSSLEASLTAHSADHEAQLAGAASRHAAEVTALREQHSKALAESAQQAQSVRGALAEALRSRDGHVRDKDALNALVTQLRQQLASMESVSAGCGWVKVQGGGGGGHCFPLWSPCRM